MPFTFDVRQLYSWPWGVLKSLQVILGLITVISVWALSSPTVGGTNFVWWVAASSLLASLVRLALFSVHYDTVAAPIPWIVSDLVICAVWGGLYVISMIIAATGLGKTHQGTYGWIALFTFLAFGVYTYNAYLRYKEYKALNEAPAHQGPTYNADHPATIITPEPPPPYRSRYSEETAIKY